MLAKKKKLSDKIPKEKSKKPDEAMDEDAFLKSLNNLQNTDPEFYDFLKENDKKLLNFNVDSDEDRDDEEEKDDDDENDELDSDGEEKEDRVHKPTGVLGEDSDDSDFESSEAVSSKKLTIKTINEWQKALQSEGKVDISTLSNVVQAFHAALMRVSSSEEGGGGGGLKLEGSGVFNSVIQMCVLYLQPAVKKVLGMKSTDGVDPRKCKRWIKVKGLLKTYFLDMFKLLGNITSTSILNVLLKHLHQMSKFIACFPTLTRALFKRLIFLWSTSNEETVRVLAFLCILRVTRNNQPLLLDGALKMMYMAYVKNCKFVSPTTRPMILFMRRSLIEMFALDVNVSYQHVFLYVRQLAIHLRNAIVLNKKENVQVVYNWQFLNSMQLWAELLSATRAKPQLQSLMYPLVMIITNTIKLIPTAQYYPLRFHCIQMLVNLSKDSDVFIPILPFLLEILTSYDFSKKHKKVSMKPMNFSCILRLSKSHLGENGFKDAVIENIYSLLLETLCLYSHNISFPDVVVMSMIQLKNFLKKCPVSNYTKKIRMVVDKIEENAQMIEKERKKVSFQLSDLKAIEAWETGIKNGGTPLQTYYDSWKKVTVQQKRKNATKNDDLADKLPSIHKKTSSKTKRSEGPVELFPSDSDEPNDDYGEDVASPPPPKKKKKIHDKEKKSKKKHKAAETIGDEDDGNADEINDFDMKEW